MVHVVLFTMNGRDEFNVDAATSIADVMRSHNIQANARVSVNGQVVNGDEMHCALGEFMDGDGAVTISAIVKTENA